MKNTANKLYLSLVGWPILSDPQEKLIHKKVLQLERDQQQRIARLQDTQELSRLKAQLIEENAEAVCFSFSFLWRVRFRFPSPWRCGFLFHFPGGLFFISISLAVVICEHPS